MAIRPSGKNVVTTPDPDDTSEFFSESVPAFTFEEIGAIAEGHVVSKESRQQTTMKDRTPIYWSDGRPAMQMVVILDTGNETEEDDGLRALYVKANLRKAVIAALKAAKANDLQIGGHLKVTFTSELPPTQRGFDPAKVYEAEYIAPER